MKNKAIALLVIFVAMVQSCCNFYPCDDETDENYVYESQYTPVHHARETLDNSIALNPAESIVTSGKIYVYNNFLFVGEKRKGFHVFDNSDPKNPSKIKFIQVLGSTDIAFRGGLFYINQATDLLAVQYNFGTNELKLVKRIKNAFPEMASPDGYLAENVPENNVVVDWKLKN